MNKQVTGLPAPKRQGRLLAFSLSGAMSLALAACHDSPPGTYIKPPADLTPAGATEMYSTNAPPDAAYVHSATPGGGFYLSTHGYYPIFGQPAYYFRPQPGARVELLQVTAPGSGGGTGGLRGDGGYAGSVSRGGFGGGEAGGGE